MHSRSDFKGYSVKLLQGVVSLGTRLVTCTMPEILHHVLLTVSHSLMISLCVTVMEKSYHHLLRSQWIVVYTDCVQFNDACMYVAV